MTAENIMTTEDIRQAAAEMQVTCLQFGALAFAMEAVLEIAEFDRLSDDRLRSYANLILTVAEQVSSDALRIERGASAAFSPTETIEGGSRE